MGGRGERGEGREEGSCLNSTNSLSLESGQTLLLVTTAYPYFAEQTVRLIVSKETFFKAHHRIRVTRSSKLQNGGR